MDLKLDIHCIYSIKSKLIIRYGHKYKGFLDFCSRIKDIKNNVIIKSKYLRRDIDNKSVID